MSKVASILNVFTKTIAKLEGLAAKNRRAAGIKTAKADVLDQQAEDLLSEAQAADKAANRLKDLLEADA
ncbi:hypothetical protein [Pseudomonas sp.]|uniref:hypothetical protein n=1 Tax=Pseudomonas sp. TaxID=306 RepID=UPI0028A5B999|nr:hypothetical protein [Pseudomonas sp.]